MIIQFCLTLRATGRVTPFPPSLFSQGLQFPSFLLALPFNLQPYTVTQLKLLIHFTVLCWLTTFYGSNFFPLMFHVYNQAANAFFAQHVTKCKKLHHSAKKKPEQVFFSAFPSNRNNGKTSRGKNFHAFSARTSAFLCFCLNVIQYKENAKKTKNKQKKKILTIIKYRS